VTADYYTEGGGPRPALTLTLANAGTADVTFTVTPDRYSADPGQSYCVTAGRRAACRLDPLASSDGWYDVTVTIDVDDCWSRRFTGHLETGEPSVTG
jgi:phospholipase C